MSACPSACSFEDMKSLQKLKKDPIEPREKSTRVQRNPPKTFVYFLIHDYIQYLLSRLKIEFLVPHQRNTKLNMNVSISTRVELVPIEDKNDHEFYEIFRNLHDENDDNEYKENDTEAKEAVDHFENVFDIELKHSLFYQGSYQTGRGFGGEQDQQIYSPMNYLSQLSENDLNVIYKRTFKFTCCLTFC